VEREKSGESGESGMTPTTQAEKMTIFRNFYQEAFLPIAALAEGWWATVSQTDGGLLTPLFLAYFENVEQQICEFSVDGSLLYGVDGDRTALPRIGDVDRRRKRERLRQQRTRLRQKERHCNLGALV
jgi:hypothetical protein